MIEFNSKEGATISANECFFSKNDIEISVSSDMRESITMSRDELVRFAENLIKMARHT